MNFEFFKCTCCLKCKVFSSWQNDVFVVAEPGELADKFLQSVKLSLSSMMRGRKRKDVYSLTKILSVSDLVAQWPKFQVGGILHRYIGRQTQVSVFFLQFEHSFLFSLSEC